MIGEGGSYELDLRQNAKTQCGRCGKEAKFEASFEKHKRGNFSASQ